jgi:hypothetical protein
LGPLCAPGLPRALRKTGAILIDAVLMSVGCEHVQLEVSTQRWVVDNGRDPAHALFETPDLTEQSVNLLPAEWQTELLSRGWCSRTARVLHLAHESGRNFVWFLVLYAIVARCAPAAATVQVLGVNLLLTPTCHESWCP